MVIFGMSQGPFTCPANLVGTPKSLRATMKESQVVKEALGVTVEVLIKVIKLAFSNGADYCCMADPASGCDLLNHKLGWPSSTRPSNALPPSEGRLTLTCAATLTKSFQ